MMRVFDKQRFAEVMDRQRVSGKELARRMGYSANHISGIRTGTRTAGDAFITQAAAALGVDVSEISSMAEIISGDEVILLDLWRRLSLEAKREIVKHGHELLSPQQLAESEAHAAEIATAALRTAMETGILRSLESRPKTQRHRHRKGG